MRFGNCNKCSEYRFISNLDDFYCNTCTSDMLSINIFVINTTPGLTMDFVNSFEDYVEESDVFSFDGADNLDYIVEVDGCYVRLYDNNYRKMFTENLSKVDVIHSPKHILSIVKAINRR